MRSRAAYRVGKPDVLLCAARESAIVFGPFPSDVCPIALVEVARRRFCIDRSGIALAMSCPCSLSLCNLGRIVTWQQLSCGCCF